MFDEQRESTLLEQARVGDRAALSQLLLEYYDDVQRHVEVLLVREAPGVATADDILQQTFVRTALGIRHFEWRGAGSFRGWLKTIAGNLVRDVQKRRRRERRAELPPLPDRQNGPESWSQSMLGLDQFAADSTSPSMRVHHRDRVQRMREAMESLPADQREVIHRYYLQQQSLDEIATEMQRTRDAVRGISHRARQNLRTLLGNSSRYFSR
jgi:RNA polymerase sigma-70 factor, ECF subfamily